MGVTQRRRFNLQKVQAGYYDVIDFPEPGDWPGRVVRQGRRWMPGRRTSPGETGPLFVPVGRASYKTMRRAARALVRKYEQ